ncbi:MAG: inositol monophosphatase family protein [Candidatus Margulisiibacteriota bacterium]|nr:inositol monophosphatase family protein [Candidatus Margulisiibacteriota bacterium]
MKSELEIDKRLNVAIRAAKDTGGMLIDNFGSPIKFTTKEDGSLVTPIDLKAEKLIIDLIKKNFPEDRILSEESKPQFSDAAFRWIIDPLDGTHNYIRGIDIFGTSIALQCENEVVIGVIYLPVARELYHAQKGRGAYRNGKRISVSKRGLSQATMIYDSSIRGNKRPMLAGLSKTVDKVFNIRMFGSTAQSLSYIAEGKADLEIEFNDKIWDFAAGLLLVEEAGGKVTDFQGRKWGLHTRAYIASNGKMHGGILRMIGGI